MAAWLRNCGFCHSLVSPNEKCRRITPKADPFALMDLPSRLSWIPAALKQIQLCVSGRRMPLPSHLISAEHHGPSFFFYYWHAQVSTLIFLRPWPCGFSLVMTHLARISAAKILPASYFFSWKFLVVTQPVFARRTKLYYVSRLILLRAKWSEST